MSETDDEEREERRKRLLENCKRQALEYLDRGEVRDAICVMISELQKHEETKNQNQAIMALGIIIATNEDYVEAKRWIVGFR